MNGVRMGLFGLLCGLAGAALADHPVSQEPTGFSPLPEVFLTAPAGFALHDLAPDWVLIGHLTDEGGIDPWAEVHAIQGGSNGDTPDFEAFALAAIRNTCTADGPGETFFCDAVRGRQPFTSDSGVAGQILYFDRVHETSNPDSKEVTPYGPIFLFDLSDKTTGEQWIALVVQPAPWLASEATDDQLLHDVARTVRVWTGPIEY